MTFSECDHVFGADINHCRAVCLRHRRSFSQGSAGLRVAPALAHISGKWLLCPLSPQGGAGSCDELWQHLGFAPTLLEINAMFCFVLFSCLRAERFVIFFFFSYVSLFISVIVHVLLSISVHLSQNWGGEVKILRDLLLLLLCFLYLAVCFLHPNKCMGPALGRKEGMLPSGLYQPTNSEAAKI